MRKFKIDVTPNDYWKIVNYTWRDKTVRCGICNKFMSLRVFHRGCPVKCPHCHQVILDKNRS